MKLTISCDAILERDLAVETVEMLTELFEPEQIFTLAHHPGRVLGTIEQRKIRSSFLSHKVKDPADLPAWAFMVPTAAKQLAIPCSYTNLINISNGLSHGFKKCDKTRQITYLLQDWEGLQNQKTNRSLRERFFGSFLEKWSLQKLRQVEELWVSSRKLQLKYEQLLDRAVEVVAPFVKLQDYPIIPSPAFQYDYYLIAAETVSNSTAKEWIDFFRARRDKFSFVGVDNHLQELKLKEPKLFFGERCPGELAPLLAGARVLILGPSHNFPKLALAALSTGRPVLAQRGGRGEEFLNEMKHGVFYFNHLKDENFNSALMHLATSPKAFDAKVLHTQVQKFGDLKFKHYVRRKFLGEQAHAP